MKNVSINKVNFNIEKSKIKIEQVEYAVLDIVAQYKESNIFCMLSMKIGDKEYLIKGLKSIWEILPNSTYDWLEKREDNKVFELYCRIQDSKNKL